MSLILSVIVLLAVFLPIAGAALPDNSNVYFDGGVTENAADHIRLRTNKQGNGYCLFLPSTVSSGELNVHFDGTLSVDGIELTSGETTDVFAGKQTVSAVINGTPTAITVYQSTLPAVFIATESGNFDAIDANKNYKEKGKIVVADNNKVYLDSTLKQIKGRGNETWNQPKKPYNFKLDSGASLLGMEKAKNWCLIASYIDNSFLRNPIASELAEMFGTSFASEAEPVALYRNGKYNGIYFLTEKVEIDKNRLNITNLEKLTEAAVGGETELDTFPRGGAITGYVPGTYKYVDIPNDPDDITGGYLLELELRDRYPSEISGFVSNRGMSVVIKEPEYASKAQVEYIRNYFQSFEDALFAPDGKNSEGKHFSEYIDVQSFADLYVLNDVLVNFDTCITSAYMYKDAGGVIHAGPVWDYDKSLGNNHPVAKRKMYNYYDVLDPRTDYVREGIVYMSGFVFTEANLKKNDTCDHIFNALYDHADFESLVSKTWNEKYLPNKAALFDFIDETVNELKNDVAANSVQWNTYGANADISAAYEADCNLVSSFLEQRSAYLNEYYKQDHTENPHSKLEPYAEESEPTPDDPPQSQPTLWQRIVAFFQRIIDFFKNLFK